ncbi:hypothetical protein G4B11_000246, partial [Aspergillus flavus]
MDFISCQDGLRLKRFSSPNLLLSSLELCNAYLTVLSRGESLTYYLGEQQSSIFLEERFRTLFCTNPPLLSPWYNQRTNILAWIGLLRHLDPKQLQIDADGICRCRIQEHTIELSESAYHMLKSGILQEFIQRWPLWGDPQKEIEITEQSIAEASKWHGFALQAVESFGSLLQELHKNSNTLRAALGGPLAGLPTAGEPSTTQGPPIQGTQGSYDGMVINDDIFLQGRPATPPQVNQGLAERSCSQIPQTDLDVAEQPCATISFGENSRHCCLKEEKGLSDQLEHIQVADPQPREQTGHKKRCRTRGRTERRLTAARRDSAKRRQTTFA